MLVDVFIFLASVFILLLGAGELMSHTELQCKNPDNKDFPSKALAGFIFLGVAIVGFILI